MAERRPRRWLLAGLAPVLLCASLAGAWALARASGAGPASPSRSLALRFVDGETGAPLAGQPYAVLGEQGEQHLLHAGRADGDGRVRLAGIADDLVVVEALRAPPFAPSARAVWLAGDDPGEVEVAVGRGSRVTGRVVDDGGEPVAGVAVALDHGRRGWSPAESAWLGPLAAGLADRAVSDERGEYAFEAVASRPAGVWLIGGESRPERQLPVSVAVDLGEGQRELAYLHAGALADARAPDLVVPRPRRIAGVVLDEDGEPLPGARVRARILLRGLEDDVWRVRPSPAAPGAEAIADERGRFALAPRFEPRELTVEHPRRGAEAFPFRAPAPGGERSDVELRLARRVHLVVEALLADGARFVPPEGAEPGPYLWSKRFRLPPRAAKLTVLFADGTAQTLDAPAGSDGLFRAALPEAPAAVEELVVELEGFRPARAAVPPSATRGEPLAVTVEPLPVIRVDLVLPGGAPPGSAALRLQACGRSYAELVARLEGPWHDLGCCGSGSMLRRTAGAFAGERAFPVETNGLYHLVIVGPPEEREGLAGLADRVASELGAAERPGPYAVFGPFRPGDEVHRIEVPAELAGTLERAATRAPAR